ncbi:acyltransferase, partial [Mycobacterium sp. ITM-2017-0098]
LPALLSTRVMVYLGHISFGLYMVHEIVHMAWNWAVLQFGIQLGTSWWAKLVVVGLVLFAGVMAAALYHGVEEPARQWMRRMIEPKG